MKTKEQAKQQARKIILENKMDDLSGAFDCAMAMYDWLSTEAGTNTQPLTQNRSFEDKVRDQLGHRLNNTPPTAIPPQKLPIKVVVEPSAYMEGYNDCNQEWIDKIHKLIDWIYNEIRYSEDGYDVIRPDVITKLESLLPKQP